jgi:HSP20 family protein
LVVDLKPFGFNDNQGVATEPCRIDRIKLDGSYAPPSHQDHADCCGGQTTKSADVQLFGLAIMITLRQSPFELFEQLEQQMATAERVPHAEIMEAESTYTVRLELPGVDHDSIDIKATDRNLVISAERPATTNDESASPVLSEFRNGTWSRSFRFPHSLNREQLKASYRDGILEITAGKAIEHTSVTVHIDK